jgi:hypothetical protein
VNPDAGLVTLQKFLGATQHSLVIGMYDFTSGAIPQTFLKDLTGSKTLQMVLDNPAPNPTRDQTDTQTVNELDGQLGKRSAITRALVRSDIRNHPGGGVHILQMSGSRSGSRAKEAARDEPGLLAA